MIHRTPFFLPWLYPSLTWRLDTSEKIIYLTFDDGPIPGATEFVLHTLDRLKAKATFFCIGDNIRKHPDIFKKIIEDGHTIGNHTFNHLNGWNKDCNTYVENVEACNNTILQHYTTVHKKIFRPPYGRVTRKQITTLADYDIIMWDVLSMDYNKNIPPHTCLLNTVKATRPGSIVVFHDSLKAEKNMAFALPRYIEHFSEKGFVFSAL